MKIYTSAKNQVQQIFKEYEISFQLKIPNKETIQALEDCIGLEEISFDDLQKDMKPKVS